MGGPFALDFRDDAGPPFTEDFVPFDRDSPLFLAAEARTDGHRCFWVTIEPPLVVRGESMGVSSGDSVASESAIGLRHFLSQP